MNDIALEKLRKYCAYQDRCHNEVRSKLLTLKVYGDDLEEIMSALISEDFLNEERFAKSFARGKFKMKKWGRIKIKNELKKRHVSSYCIQKGMNEIVEEDYLQTIEKLIKRHRLFSDIHSYGERNKIIQHLQRKGFEYETIQQVLGELKMEIENWT